MYSAPSHIHPPHPPPVHPPPVHPPPPLHPAGSRALSDAGLLPGSALRTSTMPHSPSMSSVSSRHHSSHHTSHHRDPRLTNYHNPDSLHQSGAPHPPASRSDARRWNKKVFAPDAHAHMHTFAPHHLGHAAAYQAYRLWKRTHDPESAHSHSERNRDIITDMALQEVVNLFNQYPSLNQMSKEEAIQHATGTAAHLISEMTSGILPGVISPSSTAHTLREHSPPLSPPHHHGHHRSFSRGRSRDPGSHGHDHRRHHDPRDEYDIRQPYGSSHIPSVSHMAGSYPPPSHIPPPMAHRDPYARGYGHESRHLPGAHSYHHGGSAYPPYQHPMGAPQMPLGMVGPDPYHHDQRGRSRHREYDSHGRGRSHHRSHSMSYPTAAFPPTSQPYPYQQSPYYPSGPGQSQTVSYLNTGSGMVPLPPGADLYMPSHHDHGRHRSSSRHHGHRTRDHSRGRSKSKSRHKGSRSRSKHHGHHSKHHRSGSRHHHHQPAYRSTSYDPHYTSSHRYY